MRDDNGKEYMRRVSVVMMFLFFLLPGCSGGSRAIGIPTLTNLHDEIGRVVILWALNATLGKVWHNITDCSIEKTLPTREHVHLVKI